MSPYELGGVLAAWRLIAVREQRAEVAVEVTIIVQRQRLVEIPIMVRERVAHRLDRQVVLARFGRLLLDHGRVGKRQVVPADWLDDSWDRPADVRAAFAESDNEPVLPGGWYRNQFWFVPQGNGDALVCLGIHGQMVHVNRRTGLVGVKLSSWPTAQHTESLVDTLRAFNALGAHLAGSRQARPT